MDRPPTVTQAKAIRRYVGVSKGPDFAKQTLEYFRATRFR